MLIQLHPFEGLPVFLIIILLQGHQIRYETYDRTRETGNPAFEEAHGLVRFFIYLKVIEDFNNASSFYSTITTPFPYQRYQVLRD
jgi:hypothetical protein